MLIMYELMYACMKTTIWCTLTLFFITSFSWLTLDYLWHELQYQRVMAAHLLSFHLSTEYTIQGNKYAVLKAWE